MHYKIKCKSCGATQWARGFYEPDTNAAGIYDSESLDACEHLTQGGGYDIVDEEYESEED